MNESSTYCDRCRENYYLSSTEHGLYDKQYTECQNDEAEQGRACCACPDGAICDEGSTVESIVVLPSYYRHGSTSAQVLACSNALACAGEVDGGTEPCNEGFAGPLW